MKIKALLDHHHKISSNDVLAGNLGDAYLLKHNRIFRNIRAGARRAGFQFSDSPDVNYQVLPLTQLEEILKRKHLPYYDNVSVLESLERGGSIEFEDLSEGLRRNFVFHESCHAVARSLSEISQDDPILDMMLEESFANACELLAIADTHDQVHRIFYAMNSYTTLVEMRGNLSAALLDIGQSELMKFMMLAYVHSNLLHPQLGDKQFDAAVQFATGRSPDDLGAQKLKVLRALGKVAFTLDLQFRTVTTRLHLQLKGNRTELRGLQGLDIASKLCSSPRYRIFLDSLCGIALAP